MKLIHVYCDGACLNNQEKINHGGWGALLTFNGYTKEIYGYQQNTTSNRMELTAMIRALESIKNKSIMVMVHSDSKYLVDTINKEWLSRWKLNGWKTYKGKPVKNVDLWTRIDSLLKEFDFFNVVYESDINSEGIRKAHMLANRGAYSREVVNV